MTSQNWAFQPTWTKLAGTHSIRAGYDLRVTREEELFDGHPAKSAVPELMARGLRAEQDT